MKKTILTLLSLITTFAFAEDISVPKTDELLQIAPAVITPTKKGTIYFRAITDSQAVYSPDLFPGLGVGYRRSFGHSGVDLSFNFTTGKGWSNDQDSITWTSPKVSYLYYFDTLTSSSLYLGTGLGWGGSIFKKDDSNDQRQSFKFTGLIPHITLGYELLRTSAVASFFELNISQPLIPSSFRGNLRPSPLLEFSVGAGF